MLFVAVVANAPVGITQNCVPPTAVASIPTGIVNEVITFVPESLNNGAMTGCAPVVAAEVLNVIEFAGFVAF